MAFLIGGANSAADDAYEVANSCIFNPGDTAYLSRTCGSTSTSFTFSMWVKTATTSGTTTSGLFWNSATNKVNWELNDDGQIYHYSPTIRSTGFYRDPHAWYHLVWKVDSGTGALYVNGVVVTGLSSVGSIGALNSSNNIEIGADAGGSTFAGHIAEVCFIDGSALNPTSFGEFDEDSPTIWKPKDVSGLTFGTQGFYLDFEDSSALGDDKSGNGNDYTANNLAATDQSTDTPTNNFCVMSPLAHQTRAQTLTEGNLQAYYSSGSNWGTNWASIAAKNGKWYCEVKVTAYGSNGSNIGIVNVDMTAFPNQAAISNGRDEFSAGYYSTGILQRNSETSHSGNTNDDYDSYGANDIISMAMDLDNGFLYWAKNGTWQNSGDPTSAGTGTGGVATSHLTAGDTYAFSSNIRSGTTISWNFGNPPTTFSISSGNADANGYGNFEYAPPSGYLALCTKNLAEEG